MEKQVSGVIAFIMDQLPEEAPEPVYPITAIPEGLGDPITPASIAAMCNEVLEIGVGGWPWHLQGGEIGHGRERLIPAIPVMHRWKVGMPPELWAAGGPCRSYPAAFLAEWTFLLEDRGAAERTARHRPSTPKGWRALRERWFPSSRNPPIRPQDQAWRMPPPAYFKIPDGGRPVPEPRTSPTE